MRTTCGLADQKGVALVVALVMLLVLTFVGFAAMSLTSFEAKISGNERLYNNAFYASDGGIENFRGRASTGEFVYSTATSGSYQIAVGDCTSNINYTKTIRPGVGATGDVAVFKITSEGVAPGFPVAGRVMIESVLEVTMMLPQGYN
ncbi:MAG: PilX N-terminal domain-containing pilus assembly protein [Anaerolineales bacterium]